MTMLLPLIPNPKNAKQRKEAAVRRREAGYLYAEVERLGQAIQGIDATRQYLVRLQLQYAAELARAGVNMEGVVAREPLV